MIDVAQSPHKSSGFTEDARELRGAAASAATLEERGGWRIEEGVEEE